MPTAEFAADQHGDGRDQTDQQAGGKIQSCCLCREGEIGAEDHHIDGKDQGQIDDVRTDDITCRQIGLLLGNGGQRCDELGQGGTDRDDGDSDNALGNTDQL